MQVEIIDLGTDPYFSIGKKNDSEFGSAELRITETKMQLHLVGGNYEGLLFETDLTGIAIENNAIITLGFEKDSDGCDYYISNGINIINKRVEKYGQLDIANEELLAMMWGSPYVASKNVSFNATEIVFNTVYKRVSRILAWGDSFYEGSSLLPEGLENRYISKIASNFSENSLPIFGKGGERLRTHWFEQFEKEITWFDAEYVIIGLGTNNRSYSEYLETITDAIAKVKDVGMTPVLITVTPRPDTEGSTEFKDFRIAANNYVRNISDELYIDICECVTTDLNEDTWKDGYVFGDLVHPTVLGHQNIYEWIQANNSYLIN